MAGEQQRDAQTEDQLGDFNKSVAECPALIERPEPQSEMDSGRCIEREIDDRYPPPPDVKAKPRLHGGVGEIAERVVEEMREYVGEHDETAGQPHLADADPPQPRH